MQTESGQKQLEKTMKKGGDLQKRPNSRIRTRSAVKTNILQADGSRKQRFQFQTGYYCQKTRASQVYSGVILKFAA